MKRTQAGRVRIGISGWTYAPWRGVFYPEKLAQKRELEYASGIFPTIEINGTFYSLQKPASFQKWREETPEDFVFSVKGTQYITHVRRLSEIETPLANFFASGVLALGEKLGPILWQLSPNFTFKPELVEEFFKLLPRTTQEAADLASSRDAWMKERAFLDPVAPGPVRHAMEIRHKSFVCEEFIALLRKYSVALVCADAVKWPRLMDVTSDFVYCRLHGSEELYASGYDNQSLDEWAERVVAWAAGGEAEGEHASEIPASSVSSSHVREAGRGAPEGRDVFVYFDNDAKVRAPVDAQGLMERVRRLLPTPA
jgi:uncharacterized protein YecE (DUF72 family)